MLQNFAVSILARPEGRALHILPLGFRVWLAVSILARPEGRALLAVICNYFYFRVFQSSPAPKGGRYLWRPSWQTFSRAFQSSPAPKGGRYYRQPTNASTNPCFNPRPPRRAGATYCDRISKHGYCVSILARPEGRALRGKALRDTPVVREFQSSPAPKGGRYLRALGRTCSTSRFNPRPPRRAGATRGRPGHRQRGRVSILARPEGRALHGHPLWARTQSPVSILARPEGRALRLRACR